MKIALITDQHFGGKQDSQSFCDYIERFYTNQFFPYLKENKISTIIDLVCQFSDLTSSKAILF